MSSFYLHDGDRVVFYGDSITDQRRYTIFVETFVATRFPDMEVSFVHSGWSGDSVLGGWGGPIDKRLDRDVFPYKPTVLTIMLGMNDGGVRAYDEQIFQTYSQGYLSILDRVVKAAPDTRITIIQPSPYDDITREVLFEGGYNATLIRYGDFIKKTAEERKLVQADFNGAVTDVLVKARARSKELAQTIIPDRIHPSPAGHLMMAGALLKAWSAPALVTKVEIDAKNGRLLTAEETTVSDLKFGPTLSWQQMDRRLPFPVNMDDPATALAVSVSDFTEALNQQTLRISGLDQNAPGSYQLIIDETVVGSFTADQWETGINLATLPTPMRKQAERVAALTVLHNDKHFFRWRSIQVPLESHPDPEMKSSLASILKILDREEESIVAQQRAEARPVSRKYQLILSKNPNLALNQKYVSSHPNPSPWGLGLTDGVGDGSVGHTWASNNEAQFPKHVTVDLSGTHPLASVCVTAPPYGSTKTIVVSLSEDGKEFKSVGSSSFAQRVAHRAIYDFPVQTARYVRLTYPDHHPDELGYEPTYVFTSEVEVYGPRLP